ncbi:lauroyl-Kdo(2)-lipid IV(A) myristoyltransferase [Paraferrimonas sedimenticola]|uniref:Lipid A biosynthesis myristoyltransferase n=1 Tax=Paraferrimonas sedimenticola TaxID=375674 RepID=A0AA37RVM4_9GAMM|nr:lauroyl-Kdo(2)-lipid IV(A) myristoyltransferase [Paraferrimonas sedimenticola]GLP96545.1 lipid A biosynthesis myristoyltransferase [Paraferrimonas sedimenticola]
MARKPKWFDVSFKWRYLHPKLWPTWLAIIFLTIFAYMPVRLRDGIAGLMAKLVMKVAKKPLRVAQINIKTCFPEWSDERINQLIEDNVRTFTTVLLGQGELLMKSKQNIYDRVDLIGEERLKAVRAQGQPVIFIMPHVWAIEYAGLRLNCDLPMVTMAKAHRNELFTWFNNRMRARFGGRVYFREAGIRALLSELKQDNSFFYLPDEDLGRERSEFAPFFATDKATVPVVARLAAAGNAKVMPLTIGYDKSRRKFVCEVHDVVEFGDKPTKYDEALILNQMVEMVINTHPEQYMWFLKIFQTRPDPKEYIY